VPQRIIDIDEFAGRLKDPLRNLPGEFLRGAGARQCVQQGVRARITMLVDAVTEARKALAQRNALPDDRSHIAIDQRLDELRRQNSGTAMLGALQRDEAGNDSIIKVQSGGCAQRTVKAEAFSS